MGVGDDEPVVELLDTEKDGAVEEVELTLERFVP